MTLKTAQSIARAHGISIRKLSGKKGYRIACIRDKNTRAAYEGTIEEALDTAEIIYWNKKGGLTYYWVV